MLVESMIKQTVDLQGFRVVTMREWGDGLEAELVPDGRFGPLCERCGRPASYRNTRGVHLFRHVPLWGIDAHLVYAWRRVACNQCGGTHSGKRHFTHALMVTLAIWARVLTWRQVADLFGCAWSTVAAVDEAVAYGLTYRDLSRVTRIGIDEISRKRGHVYVTSIYDLSERRLLWSDEGRGRETRAAFFDWFGAERTAKLEDVCCDM